MSVHMASRPLPALLVRVWQEDLAPKAEDECKTSGD